MNDIVIKNEKLKEDANIMLARVKEFEITSNESYLVFCDVIVDISRLIKVVDATFEDPAAAAHASHKAILAAWKKHKEPLEAAFAAAKSKLGAWVEKEQKRITEEKRMAEAKALADAEAQRKDEVKKLRDAGFKDEAKALKAEPLAVCAAPVAELTKAQGISTRTTYEFEVSDISKLKPEFLMPDLTKIGKLVRSLGKEAEPIIGGITVKEVKQVAVRA